jgi:putative ABC transport system permease protein
MSTAEGPLYGGGRHECWEPLHEIEQGKKMILNYLKIALRNMRKNNLDTILNLSGLSLGIALSLLILFHIQDELSYDRHFPKADRLYRVSCEMREGDNVRHWATTSPVIPEYLHNFVPEIEEFCRLFVLPSQILSYLPLNEPARRFKVSSGFFADQSTVTMFDLKFISGDPNSALKEVNSIILTQSTADKIFPNENPLGKMVSLGIDQRKEDLLKITGIVKDLPSNTHFDFSYLISFPTFYVFLREIGQEQLGQAKGWAALYNYVLLKDERLYENIEQKLPDFTAYFFKGADDIENLKSLIQFHIQPVVDIHLSSKLEQEFEPNSDRAFVYIFSIIAIFIVLVAAINFVNITMAQALKRMREFGVRKVLGVRKFQLVGQITGESLIYIVTAIIISLLLIQMFLPLYNSLAGKHYIFITFLFRSNIVMISGIILLVGFITCLYPALFVSRFHPIQSLKGVRDPLSLTARTRTGLVIFQFAISIFLIYATIITIKQFDFFLNKQLGFDKENIIAIQLNNDLQHLATKNPTTIKHALKKISFVSAISIVSNISGERLSIESLLVEGAPDVKDRSQFRFIRVDKDYPEVLNLNIVKGKDFSNLTENKSAFLINESAVKALQIDDPVGRNAAGVFGTEGQIIGVVKDFHFASLHNKIEPLVIEHFPRSHQLKSALTAYLLVKIKGSNLQSTIESIQSAIKNIAPGTLFTYSFIEEDLKKLYDTEQRMSNLFKSFALTAIFISCLGLFGLSSYSAQLRIKEVGIRKTLGASLYNILYLLSKKYFIWILIANLIALPLGWLFVREWLQNFAYQTNIGTVPFIITMVILFIVTSLTVGYHALRTALSNPVESLRYE